MCYRGNSPLQHEDPTCPTHKADAEAYTKAHGSKKRAPANVRGTKVEVSKVQVEGLAGEEIKRAWTRKQYRNKDKDKDNQGKGMWRSTGDGVNQVTANENTPTNYAPERRPCSQGPQVGRSPDRTAVHAPPSTSGFVDSPGGPSSAMPGKKPERKNSCSGWVRTSAGGLLALGRSLHLTSVLAESTKPRTQSSFATMNVFNLHQILSEESGGPPRQQLDTADGLSEPITQHMHQSLIELH